VPVFLYRAMDRQRNSRSGEVAGESPKEARESLRNQGLIVLEVRPLVSQLKRGGSQPWFVRRISPQMYAGAMRDLSTLLGVGIPLTESLDVLIQQYTGPLRTSLLRLRERVVAGASLLAAMREQPEVFDTLSLNMVEVGERAGNLDLVLGQLADFKERSLHLRDRVLTAMMYPMVVLLAATCVTIFLMTVVVPTLLDNLIEANRPIPWPTRVLRFGSDLLTQHGWWLALVGIVVATLSFAWGRSKSGRWWRDRTILKIPVLGEMVRRQSISRMAMVIAVMMRSGVEFLKAIDVAGRSAGNRVLELALFDSARGIETGQEMGPSLQQSGVFPPVVVQVFTVGQQTGRLEEMLERLAVDYDRQVTSASERFAAVLEPVLILVLSVVVGFIMFATMLPILEAGNVFGQGQ